MATKTLILATLIPQCLEADSRRKSLFVQKLSSTGTVCISQGTNPKTTLGATIGQQQLITLANQYDWFEANKSLGWNTEGTWWIYAYTAGPLTVVIDEGLEDSITERSKPVLRPM